MQAMKVEMTNARQLLMITCLLVLIAPNRLDAFWLTDGSLFQQTPAGTILTDDQSVRSAQSNPVIRSAKISVIDERLISSDSQVKSQSNDTAATGASLSANGSSWTQVKPAEPIPSPARDEIGASPEVISKQQQRDNSVTSTDSSATAAAAAATATCQCQPEWVHNQTSLWVGRWLNSSNFAHQIRAQVMVLAAASAARTTPQAKQNQQQAPQVSGVATSMRPRSGLGWTRHQAIGKRAGGSGPNTAGHYHDTGARGVGRVGRHHQMSANNVAPVNGNSNPGEPAPIQTQFIRGERGLKGDQGLRGERGPSGLISVKDRGALFDLDLMKSADARQSESSAINKSDQSGCHERSRLVFVESEQMLVLETTSGWRPVPLMGPLHDPRKAVAKFSLSAATMTDKQLIQLQEGSSTSNEPPTQISPLRSNPARHGGSRDSPLASNSITRVVDGARHESVKFIRNGPNIHEDSSAESDDDDGDDVDDDNEVDDDDDDDDDDNDDDDDDDDATLEGGDYEEDKDERANAIGYQRSVHSDGNHRAKELRANKIIPEAGGFRPKRRRAQVNGGSAVATEMATLGQPDQTDIDGRARNQNERAGPAGLRPISQKLRLIALNEPVSGKLRGLRGANFECKRNAGQAGIKGAFQALLATSYQNLNEIVRLNTHVQKYPIVNMRGEILATSWLDLFRAPARAANPLSRIYSFDGRHVASNPNWPNKLIWLGTSSKIGARDSAAHNCDGWHSDSLSRFGFATPVHTPRRQHSASSNTHHNHLTQTADSRKTRSHMRRSATETDLVDGNKVEDNPQARAQNGTKSTNGPMNGVFDFVDKYPCRMPLIVLCIETVAQEL